MNQVLRQVLAEELERLADADERLRLVTITAVDTAPDLRNATVFLSSLSDDAAAALAERRPQLQRSMGRQVRMKRTPQLAFAVDPAVVAGDRVEGVLRRMHQHERAEAPDGGARGEARAPDGGAGGQVRDAGARGEASVGGQARDREPGGQADDAGESGGQVRDAGAGGAEGQPRP